MKLRATLIGLVAFFVSFIIFAPRFFAWDPLGTLSMPENNRAVYSLVQLAHPFMSIPEWGDRVLEWRLLMPVIGNLLHLDWRVHFALAHVAMLGLLIYVAFLVLQRTKNILLAVVTTFLVSTSATFFVSTGFLGYYDSVLMLGIVAASFSPSAMTVWAMATLAPWVDDRFIFALPIIAWCQWCYHADWRKLRPLLLALGLGVVPYVAIRIFSFFLDGDFTRGFVTQLITAPSHDPQRMALGVWDSLRWGWIGVLAAVVHARPWQRMYALIIIPMALTVLLFCAGDYTRSMAVALPMMMVGLMTFAGAKTRLTTAFVVTLMVLNLATPAYHTFRAFRIQIFPLHIQLKIAKMIHQ